MGQFGHNFVVHCANRRHACAHQINALLQGPSGPVGLCGACPFGGGKSLILAQTGAFGKKRPVNW
jgi:hypothetical protein